MALPQVIRIEGVAVLCVKKLKLNATRTIDLERKNNYPKSALPFLGERLAKILQVTKLGSTPGKRGGHSSFLVSDSPCPSRRKRKRFWVQEIVEELSLSQPVYGLVNTALKGARSLS